MQWWEGCQMKQKTLKKMSLEVFCAKIWLELKNLEKCLKWAKNSWFFCTLLESTPILAQNTMTVKILNVSQSFWYPYHPWKRQSSGDIRVFKMFSSFSLLWRRLVADLYQWQKQFIAVLIDYGDNWSYFHAISWKSRRNIRWLHLGD